MHVYTIYKHVFVVYHIYIYTYQEEIEAHTTLPHQKAHSFPFTSTDVSHSFLPSWTHAIINFTHAPIYFLAVLLYSFTHKSVKFVETTHCMYSMCSMYCTVCRACRVCTWYPVPVYLVPSTWYIETSIWYRMYQIYKMRRQISSAFDNTVHFPKE